MILSLISEKVVTGGGGIGGRSEDCGPELEVEYNLRLTTAQTLSLDPV